MRCGCGIPNKANVYVEVIIGRDVGTTLFGPTRAREGPRR